MRKAMRKIVMLMFTAVMLCISFVGFSACTPPEVEEYFGPDLPTLFVEGDMVYNQFGEPILLQGVNAGGYLLLEGWMTGFADSSGLNAYARDGVGYSGVDHYKVSQAFLDRFGKEKAVELWEIYRANFWAEQDFINCKNMGMNVIRLPFSYMSVDPAYGNVAEIPGQKFNFSVLERFVNLAKKHGLYTILDMHGAYGSQSGKDHSGERQIWNQVDFYSNEEKQAKTVELWVAITEHFKGNPNVAAFDLLNEPGEIKDDYKSVNLTTTRHFHYYDKVHDAIREVDEDRILIIESCWAGSDIPMPSVYGWTHNIMYSFHHYTDQSNATAHISSFKSRMDEVDSRHFGVPIYMGEFTCYRDIESWEPTLTALQDAGWHWTTWTYKVRGTSPWGIYLIDTPNVIAASDAADAENHIVADTYNRITEKWKSIRTVAETTKKYTFSDAAQTTLYDVIKTACARELNLDE